MMFGFMRLLDADCDGQISLKDMQLSLIQPATSASRVEAVKAQNTHVAAVEAAKIAAAAPPPSPKKTLTGLNAIGGVRRAYQMSAPQLNYVAASSASPTEASRRRQLLR